MLNLTRKQEESVAIAMTPEVLRSLADAGGCLITAKVCGVSGIKAKLGFTAPKIVPIHRQEVYDAIQRSKGIASNEQQGQQNDQAHQDGAVAPGSSVRDLDRPVAV